MRVFIVGYGRGIKDNAPESRFRDGVVSLRQGYMRVKIGFRIINQGIYTGQRCVVSL